MTGKILLVDDDPLMVEVMGIMLSGMGQLRSATNGPDALARAREHLPDVILLDSEMPGMNGFEVCEALRADPELCDIPVIFVTAHSELAFELKALDAGAVDFIAKPISGPLLAARVRTQLRIKHLTDELKRFATTDVLTNVLNRRSFDDALAREWERGIRVGDPISLLMVDVDHFKLFNDTYGHPAGDACLHAVAQALASACARPADIVARYGGEEFAVLLPQTPHEGAALIVERVLDAIESLGVPHQSSPTSCLVTASVGLGTFDEHTSGRDVPRAIDLVRTADKALYDAKRAGRNQAWSLGFNAARAERLHSTVAVSMAR